MNFPCKITHSQHYADDHFEYKHVLLPEAIYRELPKKVLFKELEWRSIGITQGRHWEHYEIHEPEPYILLFRRPLKKTEYL